MKVLFVRLPDKVHAQLALLAQRERCSLQSLGQAAVSQLLDMAEQHGRFDEDHNKETQEESSVS